MRKIAFIFIWIFLFTMPFQDWKAEVLVEVSGTLTRLVGIAATMVAAVSLVYDGKLRRMGLLNLVLILQIAWVFMTYLWSEHQAATFVRMVSYGQMAVMVVLLSQFAQRQKQSLSLTVAYVLGATLVAFEVLRASAAGQVISVFETRFTPFENDPNDAALSIAMAIPMAWFLVVRSKKMVWILVGYGAIALISVGVLLTASRGGLLALIVGLMTLFFGFRRLNLTKRLVLAGVLALGALGAIELVPSGTWDRYMTLEAIFVPDGTMGYNAEMEGRNIRTVVWRQGIQEWKSEPKNTAVGVGAGAFKASVGSIFGNEMVAHNIFVSILVEQGLVGIILFVLSIFLALRAIRRMPPGEGLMWLFVVAVWLTGAAFLTWEGKKQTWMILAMIGARASVLPKWSGRSLGTALFGSRLGWRMKRASPLAGLNVTALRSRAPHHAR